MLKLKGYGILVGIFICMILLASCTKMLIRNSGDDQSDMTPIPESTIRAYREGGPIASELEAVIAARAKLSTSRMESVQTPDVILVERITLAEAEKRTEKPGAESSDSTPPETPVWLVVFKGTWRLNAPRLAETSKTPLPEFPGCQYVRIMESNNHGASMGSIDCSIFER